MICQSFKLYFSPLLLYFCDPTSSFLCLSWVTIHSISIFGSSLLGSFCHASDRTSQRKVSSLFSKTKTEHIIPFFFFSVFLFYFSHVHFWLILIKNCHEIDNNLGDFIGADRRDRRKKSPSVLASRQWRNSLAIFAGDQIRCDRRIKSPSVSPA